MRARRRGAGGGRRDILFGTLAVALLALVPGCREDVDPFAPADRPGEPGGSVWRLTFSAVDDRAPRWSATRDSIVYHRAGSGDDLPPDRGVVVSIPFRGGVARPHLPGVQRAAGTRRWLVSAAPESGTGRVAYVEMSLPHDQDPCGVVDAVAVCEPGAWIGVTPLLRSAHLRVRTPGSAGAVEADPDLPVSFEGLGLDLGRNPGTARGVWVAEVHPFQRAWRDEGTLVFRPAWSPDGSRIAFSDGLGLRIWRPGTGEETAVPGTEGGVSPAWSPEGEWIAFTRLTRTNPRFRRCEHILLGFVVCVREETVWEIGSRTLVLVRPDGSERRELGAGEEPAWMPDGRSLVFRRDGSLWRVAVDGTGARRIEGTGGAREPAVSPDGEWLAYALPGDDGQHDIWVRALAGTP